jgi:hypothetical protein
MTTEPATTPTTSQRTYRTSRTTQHDHATSDPPALRQRSKIKNFTAYPRITIRRISERRHIRPDELIFDGRSIDLERGA